MRIRLTPKPRVLRLFTQASANAREIARLLVELLGRLARGRSELAAIREAEHEGDGLTHEVINLLNRTFVTPFDRDDMYRLASVIDDVCDHVDEAADNIDAYRCGRAEARARAGRRRLPRRVRLHEAVELLEGPATRRQLYALRELEDEGDRLVREAIAELFRSEKDPLDDHPLEGHPRAARGSGRRLRERGGRARGDPREEPLGQRRSCCSSSIVVALVFDFTNGFHDTANAVATAVSTRALSPRLAVTIAALANLAGAFVTTAVAGPSARGSSTRASSRSRRSSRR